MAHWLGLDNAAGPWYLAWSGFVGDLGLIAALLLNSWVTARKHNCEVKPCWRFARHTTAAGHRVCRRHHPDDHLTAEQVATAHEEAQP